MMRRQSRLLVAVALLGGCRRAPALPPPGQVIEVKVVDRTPPAASPAHLDAGELARRAARVLSHTGGLTVTDGGASRAGGPRYRLLVEIRLEGAEEPSEGKGIMRAYVAARLQPVRAEPGAASFDQAAVAERIYQLETEGGELKWRAHAERAVEDAVRAVSARVRLTAAATPVLLAALAGDDDDLKQEAIRVAGERHERELVPGLIKLLRSEDAAMRDRAIGALAAIRDVRAVKPLTEVARFRDVSDLPKVLDAVAAIGGDEARAYLEFVSTGHEDLEIREMAKQALRHLEERAR